MTQPTDTTPTPATPAANAGVNPAAPVQKIVQVGLGQVASSLDAALGTLSALETLGYHAADGGLGLVHEELETAITRMREALQTARADAATAVTQVGGVVTVGGSPTPTP